MKHLFILISIVFLLKDIRLIAQPPKPPSQPVKETFFGKEVTDCYRNLENLADSTVLNWYKAQASFTEAQLTKLPLREDLFREIKEMDARFKYKIEIGPTKGIERRKNGIFYIKTLSSEQTGKMYYRPSDERSEILLFDPNKNKQSGVSNVISTFSCNYDGSKVSLVVMKEGNEVGRLLIIDTRLRKQVDSIERVWEAAAWIDNETFTYAQFPSADVHSNGFLSNVTAKEHAIGKNPAYDPVLLSSAHDPVIMPDSASFPWVHSPHRNAKYIIGQVAGSEQFNDVYLSLFDLKEKTTLNWYPFIKKEDMITRYQLQGDKAFGLSVKENKKGRILLTSAANPDWKNAKVIAEGVNGSIGSIIPFTVTRNYVYYVEVYGVEQNLYRVRLDSSTKPQHIKIPLMGTVIPFADSPLEESLRIFVLSWIRPAIVYEYDVSKNIVTKSAFQLTPAVKELDDTEVEEVYVTSHDGVKVPLSIIKPKGIKKDGSHPVIIEGYGNYGISMIPHFDLTLAVLPRHDIIRAVAHVRGGGEFGEEWRLGGFKSTKSNTWKDAIACAEYMIKEGYTTPSKMGIMGISAGGILAGRAITERPDLFAVAIPEVGVLNTLRFEFTPNGPNHIPEFGTIKNENDFKNLYEMDSYIHIKDGEKYPATLVTGGLNDPRVILWQPGKFAARLQQASVSGKPVLFRIDMHGGHGTIASTKEQQFRLTADMLAFFLSQTNTNNKKGF